MKIKLPSRSVDKVRLPSRDIKVRLNRSGIRIGLPNLNPVNPIAPVLDTCFWNDSAYWDDSVYWNDCNEDTGIFDSTFDQTFE